MKADGNFFLGFLRSAGAIIAGYMTLSVLVVLLLGLLVAFRPEWRESPDGNYLALNVLLSVLSAMSGGWVCAALAPHRPLLHGILLGLLTVVLGILYAFSGVDDPQLAGAPQWYAPLLAILAFPSVMLGTWVHVRRPASTARPQ